SEPDPPIVARSVSSDGLLEAAVERSVNRGTDYRIFITSRDGRGKNGEVGSVHDRFPLSGGGEDVIWDKAEVAWTADCGIVSLWIGGDIRGAWDVRGAWDM